MASPGTFNPSDGAGDLAGPPWRPEDASRPGPGDVSSTSRFRAESAHSAGGAWQGSAAGTTELTFPAAAAGRFVRGEVYDGNLRPAGQPTGA